MFHNLRFFFQLLYIVTIVINVSFTYSILVKNKSITCVSEY